MMRSALALAASILLLLAAMAVKGELIRLPSPPDAPAADSFDANRAAARLQRILGDERAHPVDSDSDDAVRDRLMTEMRSVGLEPRVTDDFACNGFARARAVACARVQNVVATLGPATGRHLLLSAHYDSTFAGPGAGDAGIGVATLLETAALLRGRTLQRPVTFLFNEGEEMGLIGARAFAERDPLAGQVDALLNFEARGVTGPATMFETSRPNAAAIAAFAAQARRPLANSLSTDLYRLIPNSTDVAVFEERDWTILNFAIIGNETRYHSAGDNLAALDRRSLQHMGDQAFALTLGLAAGTPPPASGERLYADFLGRQLIVLPMLFGLILLGILLLFFLVECWRRRALGRPLAAMVLAVPGAAAIAWAGQAIVAAIRVGDYWRGHPDVTETAVYASAIAACLVAFLLVARSAETGRMRAAFWLTFMLGGAAISLIAPGGAIYFLFPPLLAAAGMALSRWWPGAERIGAIAAILLLYLTLGPALALFEELMSVGPPWMFAPIGAIVLLPALIELKPLAEPLSRNAVLAGAVGLFALAWGAVALTPAYSEERRQQFNIEYVWDADAGQGRWAVNNDGAPVPFEAAWARTEFPYSMRKRWAAPAPAIPVAAPTVELVGQQPVGGGRRLRVRLRANGAETVTLVAPGDSDLRRAGTSVFLRPFGAGTPEDRYFVRCVGRSCDGAELDLVVGHARPLELMIVSTRTGLPPQSAALVGARPALARPQYSPDSTITLSKLRL